MEEWVGSLEELLEGRQQTVEEARRFALHHQHQDGDDNDDGDDDGHVGDDD